MVRNIFGLVGAGIITLAFVLATLEYPIAIAGVLAAGAYLVLLHRAGVWRGMVVLSLVASVVRSSGFYEALPEAAWYAAQFGPIIVAMVSLLGRRPRQLRRSDIGVLMLLALFVVTSAVSSLLSIAPSATLAQTGLLLLMTAFFTLTYTRRWSGAATVRGDLATVFWTITGIQGIGVLGAFTSSWAYDPDYGRYIGLFSNANYAGVVSAMAIAVGIYLLRRPKFRIPVIAGIMVLVIGMLLSGSRGALVAVVAGILVLAVARGSRRVMIPAVVTAAVVGVIVTVMNPTVLAWVQTLWERDPSADISSGRLALYAGLVEQFQSSPLFGTGYRTSELAGGVAGHNIYLSVLAETGAVGFGVFAALFVAIVIASRNGRAHRPLVGAAVTVAVMELTESSIYGFGGPTALTAWLILLAFAAHGAFLPTPSDSRTTGRRVRGGSARLAEPLRPARAQ